MWQSAWQLSIHLCPSAYSCCPFYYYNFFASALQTAWVWHCHWSDVCFQWLQYLSVMFAALWCHAAIYFFGRTTFPQCQTMIFFFHFLSTTPAEHAWTCSITSYGQSVAETTFSFQLSEIKSALHNLSYVLALLAIVATMEMVLEKNVRGSPK